MDISVIVVTYNQESSIGRTLDSILSQKTEAEFEIVIGDDCSTDGTEAVCRRYAAQYPGKIKYIRREHNLGVVGNYFDCIEKSQGRYLADCAGDDYWVDDTKLQKQYEILESNLDVSVVATQWNEYDSLKNVVKTSKEAYPPGKYFGENLLIPIFTDGAPIHLCTCLYRKDIITKAVETNRDLMLGKDYGCEDLQILLTLARAGNIIILPQVTLNYCTGHESISKSHQFCNRYAYSLKTFRQSLLLQKVFLKNNEAENIKKLRDYNSKLTNYLATLMFRSGPQICKKFEKSGWVMIKQIPLKAKIYKFLMHKESIWRFSLKLRELLPI